MKETVKIGTDISQLQMEMDGNKIKVTMPHSKILRKGISINADSLDKDHYYILIKRDYLSVISLLKMKRKHIVKQMNQ